MLTLKEEKIEKEVTCKFHCKNLLQIGCLTEQVTQILYIKGKSLSLTVCQILVICIFYTSDPQKPNSFFLSSYFLGKSFLPVAFKPTQAATHLCLNENDSFIPTDKCTDCASTS